MLLISPWRPRLSLTHGRTFERLITALVEDISDGGVSPGARLPPHRELAFALGISVGTVTKAYATLERRGLITSVHGRGTFVAGQSSAPRNVIDFSVNVPPVALSDRLLSASLVAASKQINAQMFGSYQPAVGRADHRAALARWMSRGDDDFPANQLMLTQGAQHALAIAFAVLCKPGATILTEIETYPGAITLAHHANYRLVGLAIDEEGLSPAALHDAVKGNSPGNGPRVLYVTPTLQNPTGRTMSEDRRREIVRLCRLHDITIVEDGIYAGIASERLSALATLAPERTLHVNGLSKTLSPGLRIGALVTPQAYFERAVSALQASSTMASPILSLIMEIWLADGTAQSVVQSIREEARRRTLLASRILAISPQVVPGFHVWLPLPDGDAVQFWEAAMSKGVVLTEPHATRTSNTATASGIRLCIGGSSFDELSTGLNRLSDSLIANANHSFARNFAV